MGSCGRVACKTARLDLCVRSVVHDVENEPKEGKTGDREAKFMADTIIEAKDGGDLNSARGDGTG